MKSQKTAKKPHKIMAIVPVYNEAKNLHKTLNPLNDMLNEGKIDGIIAINDGSKDSSQRKLEAYLENPGFINIVLPENMGKAFAFYCAAKASYQMGADIILMLDADLLKVSEEQIDMLINPILNNENINMTIGTTKESITYLSGQRALRIKALEPILDDKKKISWFQLFKQIFRRKKSIIPWFYLITGIVIDKNEKPEVVKRIGYGLEVVLNMFIESKFITTYDSHGFIQPKFLKHTRIVDTNFFSDVPSFCKTRYAYSKDRSDQMSMEINGLICKLGRYYRVHTPESIEFR
ncbi:MAG: glycosyltransferase [Candidatus Micrarchaeia archaeon]|jgi:glycosyltransferase involved in cell wall biosynthesis